MQLFFYSTQIQGNTSKLITYILNILCYTNQTIDPYDLEHEYSANIKQLMIFFGRSRWYPTLEQSCLAQIFH